MKNSNNNLNKEKAKQYEQLHSNLSGLLDGEPHVIAGLSNTSALLYNTLEHVNWAGFYLVHNEELLLGPFQGNVACVHIGFGKGVCGTAYKAKETILVPDVHDFPGHIACDSASLSEIVIPIFYKDKVVGVLDIDSPILDRFDEDDKKGLEGLVKILETSLDFADFNY